MTKTKNLRDLILVVAAFGAGLSAIDIKYGMIGIGAAAALNFYDRYANGKK